MCVCVCVFIFLSLLSLSRWLSVCLVMVLHAAGVGRMLAGFGKESFG